MPGFFQTKTTTLINQKSPTSSLFQYYNLLHCTFLAIGIMNKPEAFWELGMDLAIHLLTAHALRENSPNTETTSLAMLNLMREGAIYHGMTEGASHQPLIMNIADACAHLFNGAALILNAPAEEQQTRSANTR